MSGAISGFDHVSLPLRNEDAMAAFYRALGASVDEHERVVVVHLGDQMVNFHRVETWTSEDFTLRAPAATPPCGDFCLRWDGTADELAALLRDADAVVEEGPVPRRGALGTEATSVYVRDPDGNLVEFMRYP